MSLQNRRKTNKRLFWFLVIPSLLLLLLVAIVLNTQQGTEVPKSHYTQEIARFSSVATDKIGNLQLESQYTLQKIQKEPPIKELQDMQTMQTLAGNYQMFFGTNYSPPSDLPGDVKSLLNQAASDLETACYLYSKGWEDLSKYIGENKLSYEQSAKTNFSDGTSFINRGIKELQEAKSKLS